MKISGIYIIECLINNKKYVGQTINLLERLKEHKRLLIRNKHHNRFLQSSWNKYGESNFIFYTIYECRCEELNQEEIKIINEFKSNNDNFGFNFEGGGTNKTSISEETRKNSVLLIKEINIGLENDIQKNLN